MKRQIGTVNPVYSHSNFVVSYSVWLLRQHLWWFWQQHLLDVRFSVCPEAACLGWPAHGFWHPRLSGWLCLPCLLQHWLLFLLDLWKIRNASWEYQCNVQMLVWKELFTLKLEEETYASILHGFLNVLLIQRWTLVPEKGRECLSTVYTKNFASVLLSPLSPSGLRANLKLG